ncbi:hypothetical protein FBU30_011055 [Linnemannia zychae]|nr:hypothetical protein FBU30_011055 [Linnemannia zychae]
MRFYSITISATILGIFATSPAVITAASSIMSFSPAFTSSLTTSISSCNECTSAATISAHSSCAGVKYLGTVDNIQFDKLSNKEKTCLCSMTSNKEWYQSCRREDACSAGMMDAMDIAVEALKNKVFCPNGGVFIDAATGTVLPNSKVAAGLTVAAAIVGALV